MFPSYNAGATLFIRLSRFSRHEKRRPASSLECQHGKDGSKNMVTQLTNAPTSSARFRAGCPRWNLLRITAARARRNAGGDNRSSIAGLRPSGFTEPMMARGRNSIWPSRPAPSNTQGPPDRQREDSLSVGECLYSVRPALGSF